MTAEIPGNDQGMELRRAASPLVSVIIPVYNVSRYLSQCLDSVIGQTYPHLEILVIDDGSTDGSGEICDGYARRDPRIKVLHTVNRGLASARNLGLDNASGAYLSFIDSDDWVEADFIETLIKTAVETGADIVTVKSCKEYVGRTVPSRRKKADRILYRGQDILLPFATGAFTSMVWNKLYRSSCFMDRRFPDGHFYEDLDITWRLMKSAAERNGLVVFLSKDLYHYRVRKASISHAKSFKSIFDSWHAYRGRYDGLEEYQTWLLPSCFNAICNMWIYYCSFSREEKREAAETIREMHSFSKAHFHQVMSGKYRRLTKWICLTSQFQSPFIMWGCACARSVHRAISNKRSRMFD